MEDQTQSDEKILTFDVSDEALERAASAERQSGATKARVATDQGGRKQRSFSSLPTVYPADFPD
jgi:hypothetical protein